MSGRKRGSASIRRDFVRTMTFALVMGLLLLLVLRVCIGAYLDSRFDNDTYYRQQDEKYVDSLQNYVDSCGAKSDSWYQLNKWADREHMVYIRVYRDGELKFLSATGADDDEMAEMRKSYELETGYEKAKAHHVHFADGDADVILTGRYATIYYNIGMVVEILLPSALFVLIVMLFFRKRVHYIRLLSEEIHIMEGGELDHPMTIRGKDEMAMLARSLDELRVNFAEKLDEIARLEDANRDFITEMAHDLRTPMTPLLVYLGMLREGRYENEQEMKDYIEKSYSKAVQLKNMSDGMFTHFLMETDEGGGSEMYNMGEVFYDQLSAMIDYLKASGFKVVSEIRMQDVSVLVNMEYIARIFDNLVSNILKYADPQEVIDIRLAVADRKVMLRMINMINELADHSASTGFGVKNSRKMMKGMNGEYLESQKGSYYETILIFDVAGINAPAEDRIGT